MNANRTERSKVLYHMLRRRLDLPRHAPPVRIAHDQTTRTGIRRGFATFQSVLRIGRVSVKEMFQIDQDRLAQTYQIRHGISNHFQILFRRRTQDLRHLPRMCLGDHTNRRHVGIDQGLNLRIVLDGNVFTSRRTKRDEFGRDGVVEFGLRPSKEFGIFRIGSRPTGFDVVHVKGAQAFGDLQFVFARGADGFTLGAVAEGRVEDDDVLGADDAVLEGG
mmetsp:Transcript_24078/g.36583  ORF Transcript_24078/g.36583 Transcript_24078/m.36583 type:complete len:219 (-) Transcript_24078:495-1151(-)